MNFCKHNRKQSVIAKCWKHVVNCRKIFQLRPPRNVSKLILDKFVGTLHMTALHSHTLCKCSNTHNLFTVFAIKLMTCLRIIVIPWIVNSRYEIRLSVTVALSCIHDVIKLATCMEIFTDVSVFPILKFRI